LPHSSLSDFELITLLKADDEVAFKVLYDRYFSALYNHAYEKLHDRCLAQEAVQDVFVHIWQHRQQLYIQKSVGAFLFIATRNVVINQFKKQIIYQKHCDTFATKPQNTATNFTDEWMNYKDLHNSYQSALQQLPEKCRKVFLLSREGYTYQEISTMLGISPNTVEQHIRRALQTMRLLLTTHLNTWLGASFLWISTIF
jgi:RNA polymerase sigma-70 factor (ECF subfamily)